MRIAKLNSTEALLGCCAIAIGALIWIAASTVAGPTDSSALWHVVHDLCVPDMKTRGGPAPCVAVDLNRGYAVLKDIRGATQLLVIPTRRVTGIEDPQVLAEGSPNYWQDAWDSRRLFERRLGRPVPRDDLGLAINSRYSRSQNQLHIHIDCVWPEVRQTLETHKQRIGETWSNLDAELAGHLYRVRRLDGPELGSRDPFKLLATADPTARADMSRQSLAVIGATFDGKPGFILLSNRAGIGPLDQAHGEELLDHRCEVLKDSDAAAG